MMDQLPQVENALDDATDAVEQAADTVVEETQEATAQGETETAFTLDMVGKSLRGIEVSLKSIVDDIKTIRVVPEEAEKTVEGAADFVVPDIDEAPKEPKPKGTRRKRQARMKKR